MPRGKKICKPVSVVAEPRPSKPIKQHCHSQQLALAAKGKDTSKECAWVSEYRSLELKSTVDLLLAFKPHHSLLRVIHSSSQQSLSTYLEQGIVLKDTE